jgi:hypothetical protein
MKRFPRRQQKRRGNCKWLRSYRPEIVKRRTGLGEIPVVPRTNLICQGQNPPERESNLLRPGAHKVDAPYKLTTYVIHF